MHFHKKLLLHLKIFTTIRNLFQTVVIADGKLVRLLFSNISQTQTMNKIVFVLKIFPVGLIWNFPQSVLFVNSASYKCPEIWIRLKSIATSDPDSTSSLCSMKYFPTYFLGKLHSIYLYLLYTKVCAGIFTQNRFSLMLVELPILIEIGTGCCIPIQNISIS